MLSASLNKTFLPPLLSVFFFGGRGKGGGGSDLHLGVQEDDIAMKGAQSKIKWGGGAMGGGHGENGGGGGMTPKAPHSYATVPH